MTDLGDGLLLGTNETEKGTEHTEEGDHSTSQGSTSLWVSLEGQDGVNLGDVDEGNGLLADVRHGVLSERREAVIILNVGQLVGGNLERLLDLEGLGSESLGILNGVTDEDVVEEDVLVHSPELNTNTADLGEALDRGEVLEVRRVRDFARGPFTDVVRVVDLRRVPFALVLRVCLGGAAMKSAQIVPV